MTLLIPSQAFGRTGSFCLLSWKSCSVSSSTTQRPLHYEKAQASHVERQRERETCLANSQMFQSSHLTFWTWVSEEATSDISASVDTTWSKRTVQPDGRNRRITKYLLMLGNHIFRMFLTQQLIFETPINIYNRVFYSRCPLFAKWHKRFLQRNEWEKK